MFKTLSIPMSAWWVVVATGFNRMMRFMVMPFIALYMTKHTNASPGTIGLAIGMSAISSVIFGLIGGRLADQFGKKQMMIFSSISMVCVMIGFANANVTWLFFILNALNGITECVFAPASQSILMDIVGEEHASKVFPIRYWIGNIGAVVGPLIGGFMGSGNSRWLFYVAALVNFIWSLIILCTVPNIKDIEGSHDINSSPSFRRVCSSIFINKSFIIFILAIICLNIGYSQIETTLPQVIERTVSGNNASKIFSIVYVSNAVEVIILQLKISQITKKLSIIKAMFLGQCLFVCGFFIMSLSQSLWVLLAGMLFVALGEIVLLPRTNEYTASFADTRTRGTFFGAYSFSLVGFFIGPWLGGLILHHFNGSILFIVNSIIILCGALLFPLSSYFKKQNIPSVSQPLSTSYNE